MILVQNRSTGDTPVLQTEHLSRTVSGARLVDDITMRVLKGELLAVVGPTGSGKTSFLRLLNRLDEPTSGTVYLEGRDYRTIPPRELRRRMGTVTQTPFLFPGTVAENLKFGPRQRGVELSKEAIARLLEEVGLPGFAESDASHLSGGEAQRVSVARALANSPGILLLDEPTSALDDHAKHGIESLILKVVEDNTLTCIVVTHDIGQASRMAERAMVLRSGKLERIGPIQEVLDAEANL